MCQAPTDFRDDEIQKLYVMSSNMQETKQLFARATIFCNDIEIAFRVEAANYYQTGKIITAFAYGSIR